MERISVVSQDRADAPGTVSGNTIHDNTVALGTPVAGDSSDKTLLAFNDDWTSGMYTPSAANTAAHNAYWSLAPEPQWARFGQWNGTSVQTLAALNTTPVGGASTYLSTAALDSLLAAAGLPLAP
jgi:hypothetical protein